ncbi:hypothetical protein LTR59_008866 [Friedmanniomyces endolithicus]|nr:hypothetical protein LTR94_019556 [Friedmanniomyces endolithicus]KAK0791473.1 hypothetical protein LTR59_008866 [Friedmanniomyces endolithicus]KAK0810505.1 hypothetical protein LTR38_003990 [Friedmanniomyces endolithicus]
MFRRTSENLPQDPCFPADLHALGYKVNELGQFVEVEPAEGTAADFFDFYHTDSERANEVRKEAMHECARKEILERLSELGVKPLFVYGQKFTQVKPGVPYVSILATNLAVLKKKKDVLVIVNEHKQDLGIWAYRLLLWQAGIEGGSAVGMVKKLKAWQSMSANDSSVSIEAAELVMKKLKLAGNNEENTNASANTPGVIILNPGQLRYSHKEHRGMSQDTWLARPKTWAMGESLVIHEVHNRVPGHENPEAHIRSVLEHVVPVITSENVRLYFVGLSDGGENLLKYLDDKLFSDHEAPIGANLEGVALIQPTHLPYQLKSVSLGHFLASPGARSWVSSDKPKGELLIVPSSPITHFTSGASSMIAEAGTTGGRKDSGSDTSTSTPIPIPGARTRADSIQPSRVVGPEVNPSVQSRISDSNTLVGDSPALEHSMQSLPSDSWSLDQRGPWATRSRAGTTDSNAAVSTGDPSDPSDLNADIALAKEAGYESPDLDIESYPYHEDPVSCPTFSAGVEEVSELLWPTVMDDVLEWFKSLSEYADEREKSILASQQMMDLHGSWES